MSNYFFPIAGANEVGASSYYVKLQGRNIIFDCGARSFGPLKFPNYHTLVEQMLDDYSQIDMIVISHAHYDHIGSLYNLAMQATRARIYATKITKQLIRLQLIQFERAMESHESERIRALKANQLESIINRIIEVPVFKPIEDNGCKLTFYPAGHMAGAIMSLVECEGKRVLYTGDFSFTSVMGMNELKYRGEHPDVMILNATYGYTNYEHKGMDYKTIEKRMEHANRTQPILIHSRSIAKHLDFFYALKMMRNQFDVYLEPSSAEIADALVEAGYDIYSSHLKVAKDDKIKYPIVMSTKKQEGYYIINADLYSLHATFRDLINMVYLTMPQTVYVVHTKKEKQTLSFMDDLKDQGRFHGKLIECKNETVYQFD